MNKKQKKISLIIWLIFLIISISLIIYFKNSSKYNNWVIVLDKNNKDVLLLNEIVNNSTKLEDYKKCEKISLIDLKNNCIAQVKLKFSDIWTANTTKDCESIKWDNELWTQSHRKDVCFLNLINKNSTKNKKDLEKICSKIKNNDLKTLCNTQVKNLLK